MGRAMMHHMHEPYKSSNGDVWFLETTETGLFVVHQPCAASGGRESRLTVEAFLQQNTQGPEVEGLVNELRASSETALSRANTNCAGA
jgi:hypothetical protein